MRKRASTGVALLLTIATGGSLLIAPGAASAKAPSRARTALGPRLVSWADTITFTYAAPGQPFPAGTQTVERIIYNPRKVDADGNVVIIGHQHYLNPGQAGPGSPGGWGAGTPTSNLSTFNVQTKTESYDVQVTHTIPVIGADPFLFAETPYGVVAFYSQTDGSLQMLGHYEFSSAGPQPCNARTYYASGTC